MTTKLATCVLAALSVCAIVYSQGGSSVYRDPQQRFTLHVPNGWNVAPIGEAVQLSRGNAYASLVVSNGESDPAGLVANLVGQISRQWRNFTELKRGDSTLASQRAAYGLYSGVTPKGQDSLMKIVATAARQKSFVFIMSSPTGEFNAAKAGFDEIERGFSVAAAPAAAGSTPARPDAPQTPQGESAPSTARPSAGVIRLRPHVVMDPLMGIEAFRFLVPVDWKVEGGVVWRHVPTRPAAMHIRAFNPNGVEELGALPDVPCVWAQTLPAFGFREGSNYIGNEVRRPINDAIQAIRLMIVPRYRPHLRTATIVKQEPLPELAKAWAAAEFPDVPQAEANIRAGRIRFAYQQSGKTVEEDVYTVVGWFTVPVQGGSSAVLMLSDYTGPKPVESDPG